MIGGEPVNARSAMIANRADDGSAAKEHKNIVQGFSRLSRRDLSDFVPKGLQDSARGFNPWKHVHAKTRPEGAEDIRDRRFVWSTSAHLRHRFYRPLRGGPFFNRHLGLKPQAESFSPFGTQDFRELQSNIPELHHSAPQYSRTACPTKPKLYSAGRSSRPRKRGTLHNQDAGEVGRTSTRTKWPVRLTEPICIGQLQNQDD